LLNIIAGSLSAGVAPVTGSYESIATVTVGSGGSSSISFTSIPSTFTHLQIRYIARGTSSSAGQDSLVRFNGDTGSNYSWHLLYGDGATVVANSSANATSMYIDALRAGGTAANIFTVGVVDILDYANTSKYKTIRTLSGDDINSSSFHMIGLWSGNWRSTSAISSITIFPDFQNYAEYTQFALYGIKGV